MRVRCVILFFSLFCALVADAQVMSPHPASEGQGSVKPTQEMASSKLVQPYTAHFKITRVVPWGNGSTKTLVSTETDARDRSGRRYWGINQSIWNVDHDEWTLSVLVRNASGHTSLIWNSKSRVASLQEIPEQATLSGCWVDASGMIQNVAPEAQDWHPFPPLSFRGKSKSIVSMRFGLRRYKGKLVAENLGNRTINGQTAFGLRTTFTPLDGGPEAASLESTDEWWKSTDLNLMMREISNGPKQGSKKRELIDLKLDDPAPSLFEPPTGYKVETVELNKVPCAQ